MSTTIRHAEPIQGRDPNHWGRRAKKKKVVLPTISVTGITPHKRYGHLDSNGRPLTEGQRRFFNMVKNGHEDVCYLCGVELADETRTIDHRTPKARGGRGFANLALCCLMCNWTKNNLTEDEYRMLTWRTR